MNAWHGMPKRRTLYHTTRDGRKKDTGWKKDRVREKFKVLFLKYYCIMQTIAQ